MTRESKTNRLTPLELCRLTFAKNACLDNISFSLPNDWPLHLARLISDATSIRPFHILIDDLRVILADVATEIATIIGPSCDPVVLTSALSGIAESNSQQLVPAISIALRNHFGNSNNSRLVDVMQTRRAIEYIDNHLNARLTIGALGRVSGWPQRDVAGCFKASTGMTLHQYVVRARIRRAIELLLQGVKVFVVMQEVGYRNKTSFNQAFKKVTGCTPKQFRKSFESPR